MQYREYYNQEIATMVQEALKDKEYDDIFKTIICDGMMRKAYYLQMPMELVREQIGNIARRLNIIRRDSEDEYDLEDAGMSYWYNDGKVTYDDKEDITKRLIKDRESLEDISMDFFEGIVHEIVFHVAQHREDGSVGLLIDSDGIKHGEAFNEGTVEKTAGEICFNIEESNEAECFLYFRVVLLIKCVSAIFGVGDREFLKYADMGREGIEQFLSQISNNQEEEERNRNVFEAIELNLDRYFDLNYGEKCEVNAEEKQRLKAKYLSNIYAIGINHINYRFNNRNIESFGQSDLARFIYDRDRLNQIYKHKVKKFIEEIKKLRGHNASSLRLYSKFFRSYIDDFPFLPIDRFDEEYDTYRERLVSAESDEGRIWNNQPIMEVLKPMILQEVKNLNRNHRLIQYSGEDGKTYIRKENILDRIRGLWSRMKNVGTKKLGTGENVTQVRADVGNEFRQRIATNPGDTRSAMAVAEKKAKTKAKEEHLENGK